MKKLFLGNEAVARGLYEAGVSVISSYPGTPSTEITEYAATYDDMYSEWAPNEKVSLEVVAGTSFAGKRAFAAMKHVGLNVAADPLYTLSYTGVNGGLVIAVADDPGMHSSQNEQDTRNHAKGSKVPIIEPANSQECLDFTKIAYEISEQFDTPVILRLTTRIAHSRSLCTTADRVVPEAKKYERDIAKYVMMPAMARPRHVFVEERTAKLSEWSNTAAINRVEYNNDRKIGVICAGNCYEYAREALGDTASYLKLGMVWPMPTKLLQDFAANVETLYVIEELDGFIESHLLELGIKAIGKELFPMIGEFSQSTVREKILGETPDTMSLEDSLPPRPPVMCAGCPHRGVFWALKKLGVYVSGDIGCYTLGAAAPLSAIDACICMGGSIPGAHGFDKAGRPNGQVPVAVIGDSTFMHSGVTGLINVAYNNAKTVTMILDNSITGMTGHQQNPSTGLTIKNEPTNVVDIEAICRAVGIKRVRVVDPYDMPATYEAIKEETECNEASVIIARRACALLKDIKHKPALKIDNDKCIGCRACLAIGCPATSFDAETKKVKIDDNSCVGCGQCTSLCRFGAIVE